MLDFSAVLGYTRHVLLGEVVLKEGLHFGISKGQVGSTVPFRPPAKGGHRLVRVICGERLGGYFDAFWHRRGWVLTVPLPSPSLRAGDGKTVPFPPPVSVWLSGMYFGIIEWGGGSTVPYSPPVMSGGFFDAFWHRWGWDNSTVSFPSSRGGRWGLTVSSGPLS